MGSATAERIGERLVLDLESAELHDAVKLTILKPNLILLKFHCHPLSGARLRCANIFSKINPLEISV